MSYRRLDSTDPAKYGCDETDGLSRSQQTNEADLEDDGLVGYSLDFTQPKNSFFGRLNLGCRSVRVKFSAALRLLVKLAFGKWPIALIILICYIALTVGLIVISITGKYREFRTDISLGSFMVPDIKVSDDLAAFNGAKEHAKSRIHNSGFRAFLNKETCTGNKIDPLPRKRDYPRRLKRSTSYSRMQSRPLGTLDLVYVAKGANIFTEERLREIHNIEKTLMMHEGYEKHCLLSSKFLNDKNLKKYGNCTPPNSMSLFFFPSPGRLFDGQGETLSPIEDTLKFLQSREYFFSYVSGFKNNTSKILRAQLLFGKPVEGIPETPVAQKEGFKRYVRTYVDTLDKLNNNNHMSVLYGGGDLFDYLVNRALLSDLRLAAISLGLIILLLLILTFSWWLSFMAVLSIVSSVGFAYFFYRVVFENEYMGILNGVSLFVIIGIGVDDIFVFINTFRQAVDNKDLGERIFHTISVAGTATFFTSFTTAAAFGANALSPIPAIHDFGLFMAVLVAGCWISVLFIMSPALVLWHAGIEKLESAMCNKVLSAIGVKRSEHFRLPDDIRQFLSGTAKNRRQTSGSESRHEVIPLVNNSLDVHDGDGDGDDEPLLVPDYQSTPADESTPVQSTRGTESFGFRFQSILYHFVARPVVKARVVIFVAYLFILAISAFMITKLKVSTVQPKFFKTDSNLQRWLELPEVSLPSNSKMIDDIEDLKNNRQPGIETTTSQPQRSTSAPHVTPNPKHTEKSTQTKTREHRTTQPATTVPFTTRKLRPFTKRKTPFTRLTTTETPVTRAPSTQEETKIPTTKIPTTFVHTDAPETDTTTEPLSTSAKVTNTTTRTDPRCPDCANGGICNNVTFKCHCQSPYTGPTCSKYCPVRTMTGECCAIPFKYENQMRYGCLIEQQTQKPWCSITTDYENDGKRGYCNKTVENSCTVRTLLDNKTCCTFPFTYHMVQYYSCILVDGWNGSYCGTQEHISSRTELVQCNLPNIPYPTLPTTPSLCSKQNCKRLTPPPNEATAVVYLVFGIKGIDKSSIDLRHVLKETGGMVLYDKIFSKDMSCKTERMAKSACKICKTLSSNEELVQRDGAQCFPDDVQWALEQKFPHDCQDLPKAKSKKIKSVFVIKNASEVEWFAMAFSSTTSKRTSFATQRKDYEKWEEKLKVVLSDKDLPDSMKSAFQTSETWVKMFSGIIVVDSAVYGIVVSLLLCLAAVIIFTGHVLLFMILFMTILGVLLLVTTIFYLTGWQLGGVEAISLSILVGTSVDYCFHLVEAYILAGEAVNPALDKAAARQWRAMAAMSHIGMSIISSAITTILAAIPLCLTQIQLFAKFGLIVTINTAISLFYTLTVTMAMLSMFGPARFRTSFRACVIWLIVVGSCAGLGVMALILVSKGGHCIEGPSGTPLFKC